MEDRKGGFLVLGDGRYTEMVFLDRDDFYWFCLFLGSSDFIRYCRASPGESLGWLRRGAAWDSMRALMEGTKPVLLSQLPSHISLAPL